MPGENIVDLEGLLKQYIGPDKDIVDIKRERLTAPGENYCSIMLKLDITLRNLKTGMEESLSAVAKTINVEVSEFFRKAAPMQFKKEIAFYTQIVPALQAFQKEQGVTESLDLFPKLYAARANLHGKDDEVDDETVIILENLKEQGYSMIDRIIGFDLDGAKLILKDLALFHAVPVALKLKDPKKFEDRVNKACAITPFGEPPKRDASEKPPEWLADIAQDDKSKPYFNGVCAMLQNMPKDFFAKPFAEPFATISHCDMWVNNTMQLQKNGSLVRNKFVDFQLYRYGSAICDVIHFIFASCQNYVSSDHLDDLLKFYHTQFVEVLKKHGCAVQQFEYSKFLERVEIEAPAELMHTIIMAVPIQGKKGVANVNLEDEDGGGKAVDVDISVEAKQKIVHDVYEFGKRGWIK